MAYPLKSISYILSLKAETHIEISGIRSNACSALNVISFLTDYMCMNYTLSLHKWGCHVTTKWKLRNVIYRRKEAENCEAN